MQEIRRRAHGKRKAWRRPALLALLAVIALASLLLWQRAEKEEPVSAAQEDSAGIRRVAETEEISRVSIALRSSSWTAEVVDGSLITPDGTAVSPSMAEGILAAARYVGWTEVLSEDAAWQERLDEFGLATPYITAAFTYTDGETVTLRIGDRLAGEESGYYLWIEGDDRLLALDTGTVADLSVDETHLLAAQQPGIDKARIDRVTVTDADGVRIWALEGAITDGDAADRWYLTEPFRYPADSDSLVSLRENLAGFRLGAFICADTPENRALYGLDTPRCTVEVHMAAGTVLVTDDTGAAVAEDRGEETVTILIGSPRSDMVDYVCCRGQIGIASRFTHESFSALAPEKTLTRYLVLTSLSSLQRLTIRSGGEETVYEVSYDLTEEDTEVIYDTDEAVGQVTRNGEPISWEGFSGAWSSLLLVTASGTLPEGWQSDAAPDTVWTFETRTGLTRTLALTPYDPLHDAVILDGTAVFYLIRGGLSLE